MAWFSSLVSLSAGRLIETSRRSPKVCARNPVGALHGCNQLHYYRACRQPATSAINILQVLTAKVVIGPHSAIAAGPGTSQRDCSRGPCGRWHASLGPPV